MIHPGEILFLRNRAGVRKAFCSFEEDLSAWDGQVMVRAQEELYLQLAGLKTADLLQDNRN